MFEIRGHRENQITQYELFLGVKYQSDQRSSLLTSQYPNNASTRNTRGKQASVATTTLNNAKKKEKRARNKTHINKNRHSIDKTKTKEKKNTDFAIL